MKTILNINKSDNFCFFDFEGLLVSKNCSKTTKLSGKKSKIEHNN
jgi:hypothetical protein